MASEMSCVAFMFEDRQFRTIPRNGDELWFVLSDVCQALELSNVTETAKRLDADEFSITELVDSLGKRQEMLIVSEPGFYKLTETSRKPVARRLNRFVRHELMPSVRKYGCYPPPANLAPPPAMAELVNQFTEFRGEVRNEFKEVNAKLTLIVDNSNKGRKDATAETVRTHHKGICHHYFYCCPCEIRCGIQIADENGFIDGTWHHHHQYGAWDNRPEAMIPLAKECHERITKDVTSRLRFDQTAFPQFQDLLARMPVKQLTLQLSFKD